MKKFSLLLLITYYSIFILNCRDCFSQWIEQNSGVNVALNSVSAVGSVAWICGNAGTVLKSTNAGVNWINVSSNGIPSNVNLTTITQYTPLFVLTAGNIGSNTFVYRTTNGGINWNQVFTQTSGSINAIAWIPFVFLLQGNPVGGRWSLWKSADNGMTWDSTGLYLPQLDAEIGWSNSLYNDNGIIWFGTNNSRVYYSSNFGTNWVMQSTIPEINIYSIWFEFILTDALPGIGLAGGTNLLKSTNQGANWMQVSSPGSGNIIGISGDWMSAAAKKWYIRNNSIYATTNYGSNWNTDYTSPAGSYNHISVVRGAPVNIWAVRNNGGISKYPKPNGINIISIEVPAGFKLYQNYPNPFNPETKIRFSLPNPSGGDEQLVKIIIFDILGREIITIVNEKLHPGTYEVSFNGENLPTGVYYYILITENYRATKIMILVK